MKISILTPNLSENCFGRAYLLADMLKENYKIEIVGPILGDGIWRVIDVDKKINIKGIECNSLIKYMLRPDNALKEITGDVIYVSKPHLGSFGIGLLKSISRKKPLIIDIDDWELGFLKDGYQQLPLLGKIKRAINPVDLHNLYYLSTLLCEKLTRYAKDVTVSNKFLQKKFGGTLIWHARDDELFKPEKYNKSVIREKYGITTTDKIVMFLGTPAVHKGIEDLVNAVALIINKKVKLVIIGMDERNKNSLEINNLGKKMLVDRYVSFGLQPFQKAPELIAMADVIVIPQKESPAALGQMPAKVFDAMAMAKPIIATSICDLPEVLDGCGWIVEPENPKQLSGTIDYVLSHPEKQEEYGWKAREKFISNYSKKVMEKVLLSIFKKYVN